LKALSIRSYSLVLAGLLIYLGLSSYRIANSNYFLVALPLLAALFYALVRYPQFMFFTVVALTPFSLNITIAQSFSFYFPTEPLIVAIMGLYVLSHLVSPAFDRRVMAHPLTLLILFNLLWILVCTFTSTLPVISLKFFFMRLWYVVVFYFMALDVFRYFGRIRQFLWILLLSLSLVVVYATFHHLLIGLSQNNAGAAPGPFFKDHTIYGATVALLLPVAFAFLFRCLPFGNAGWQRSLALLTTLILLTGLMLSFSRAAWLSVGVSVVLLLILLLRIHFRTLIIWGAITGGLVAAFWTPIVLFLQENEATSDETVEAQLQSIYNVTNDASNTERINRWFCAWRMFEDRPVFGFGPGSYESVYASYQRLYQKTKISTTFGNRGNAHSEYLGPLAEFGLFGMLSKLGLLFVAFYKGMQLYYNGRNLTVRITALTITIALATYFSHGFLNNFLNYDKAAVPFFGFLAILTALEVYFNKPPEAFDADKRPAP
jgi:putative inorganic carbon (HCO3(-)) transporter